MELEYEFKVTVNLSNVRRPAGDNPTNNGGCVYFLEEDSDEAQWFEENLSGEAYNRALQAYYRDLGGRSEGTLNIWSYPYADRPFSRRLYMVDWKVYS